MKNQSIVARRAVPAAPRPRVPVAACCAASLLALFEPSPARAEPEARILNLSLEELGTIKIDTVFAASKFSEKVTDAPSSVTIVTRDEITRFGYRTLSDIVRAVRSFDVVYDRTYSYTGARGFNSVDDYGSRTLLLIDGHRMNDPIYAIAAVGTEGLLEVGLIERVEFIRGPGSAIYGSNAFLAVINVVTRSGASVNGVEASADAGSFGTYSGRFSLGKKLANGIEYLVSGTTYTSDGPGRLFYQEFDAPETNQGIASHLNAERYWCSSGAAAEPAAPPAEAPTAIGGTETILAVEDEPDLRELVQVVLERAGYRVLLAENGPNALAIFEEHGDEIDLLITDMVMPGGITGRELAAQIQIRKPGLRAVFTSGYSADLMGDTAPRADEIDFLQKPYDPDTLLRLVRASLGGCTACVA